MRPEWSIVRMEIRDPVVRGGHDLSEIFPPGVTIGGDVRRKQPAVGRLRSGGNELKFLGMLKPAFEVPANQQLAYSSTEACRLLGGISSRSLRRLELRGLLRCVKGLRRKLWTHADLITYLNTNK